MSRRPMVLAGDIGGTKTLIGLFEARSARPEPIVVREFSTLDHADLMTIVSAFVHDRNVKGTPMRSACFGVAGPVAGNAATLTNVPRHIDGETIARAFDIPRVVLVNDLQAMACGVPVLRDEELCVLQEGDSRRGGNIALIAAGTGLGEALLHYVDGRFIPSPSESGHADFPARTEREIALLRDLLQRHGRASVEQVLSGLGLVNVHRVTHDGPCLAEGIASRGADPGLTLDLPAIISKAALERRCRGCIEALDMFVEAYGAEAGNLALRTLSTGGVFVGGGIAPKILPALTDGRFVRAFVEKAPLDDLLRTIPIKVILNAQVGLLGAAVSAAGQTV